MSHLNNYFSGVAAKALSAHEVDPAVSNGHEFQGVNQLREILGTSRADFATRFLSLRDDGSTLAADGKTTWYDSRENQPRRSAEFRLYYSAEANDVVHGAVAGDTMIIGRRHDGPLLVVICPTGSSVEQQVRWLFGLAAPSSTYSIHTADQLANVETGFAARAILGDLGIEASEPPDRWKDLLLDAFGLAFPGTEALSAFARSTLTDVDPAGQPDATLVAVLEREYELFRTMERVLLEERLRTGFLSEGGVDVDGFLKLSQSVNQRRKSRAGSSFENHLAWIFSSANLVFQRNGKTEHDKRPDFLFPGSSAYANAAIQPSSMTLLGAKTTCKDRWRQVLSEGDRIPCKHLATLEPGISATQTIEMQAAQLKLVVPRAIHESYLPVQREWLMDIRDFILMVREQQRNL